MGVLPPAAVDDVPEASTREECDWLRLPLTNPPDHALGRKVLVGVLQRHQLVNDSAVEIMKEKLNNGTISIKYVVKDISIEIAGIASCVHINF